MLSSAAQAAERTRGGRGDTAALEEASVAAVGRWGCAWRLGRVRQAERKQRGELAAAGALLLGPGGKKESGSQAGGRPRSAQ